MFKRLGRDAYICDTKEDLKTIPETDLGAECYIIKEAAQYLLMSDGQWVRQMTAEPGQDLSSYATEEMVDEIKVNPVFKMFDTETYKTSQYTFFLKAEEGKSLAEAMKEKGLGFYTFWMQKGHSDLPAAMNQANLSGRGFCCLDYFASETDYIGWIVMFNKNNEMYYRFINHAVTGPWMKIATTE